MEMESGGLGLYDEVTQFCSISGVGIICILGGLTINRKALERQNLVCQKVNRKPLKCNKVSQLPTQPIRFHCDYITFSFFITLNNRPTRMFSVPVTSSQNM